MYKWLKSIELEPKFRPIIRTMNQFNEILKRLDDNRRIGYSLIRIFLGSALFIRGWILVSDPGAIDAIAFEQKLHMWHSYITIGHLLGGFSLIFGLFARLGALLQIPILTGAVFIVQDQGLMMGGQSLELASLVLFLLIIFFVFGPGSWALSRYFRLRYI